LDLLPHQISGKKRKISKQKGNILKLIRTIKENKSLIYTWIKFDIQANYIDTKLGLIWLFLEPIFQTLVYAFIFSALLNRLPKGNVPFIIFYLAGISTWQFINLNWISAGLLFVRYGRILSDVKISAEALVVIEVLEKFVEYMVNFVILVIICAFFGYFPTITYLYIPFYLVVLFLMTIGGTFFLSTSGIFIRDISNITGMIMRLLFFLSGVIITPDMLPNKYSRFLMLNPILHFMETIRNLVIYSEVPSWQSITYMISCSLLVFVIGYSFFRKRQGIIVDYR
jgi:ABC-type polysaccharide/polyol phosphate export permease